MLLLLVTLVGLAAMHTLGHGTAAHAAMTPMPAHATAAEGTATMADGTVTMADGTVTMADGTATMADGTATTAGAPAEVVPWSGCPDGHCARLSAPPARHDAGMDWWDVCVAVLTALGVLLVLFWLAGVVSRRRAAGLSHFRAGAASRGPPVRGLGLTLATVSVMRH